VSCAAPNRCAPCSGERPQTSSGHLGRTNKRAISVVFSVWPDHYAMWWSPHPASTRTRQLRTVIPPSASGKSWRIADKFRCA